LLLNLVSGHDLAGPAGQQGQQLEGLGWELQRRAIFADFFQLEV
jgi:hypothetical protein